MANLGLALGLLLVAAAAAAEPGRRLPHQRGAAGVVTVVTASLGREELARCIASVQQQSYAGAIQHLVLADGAAAAAAVLRLAEPLGLLPSPETLAGAAPRARWLDVLLLPYNTGDDGGRIYAAAPTLTRGEFVQNLDDDNYLDPEHVASLVAQVEADDLDWAYSLRAISLLGQPITLDRFESLGMLHAVWDWDGTAQFTAARSQHHIDTSCYFLRRSVAIAMSPFWNCLPRHNDRCYLEQARRAWPRFGSTRQHTLYYNVSPQTAKGLSLLGYFSEGEKNMTARFGDQMPWEESAPSAMALHSACAGFNGPHVPFYCAAKSALHGRPPAKAPAPREKMKPRARQPPKQKAAAAYNFVVAPVAGLSEEPASADARQLREIPFEVAVSSGSTLPVLPFRAIENRDCGNALDSSRARLRGLQPTDSAAERYNLATVVASTNCLETEDARQAADTLAELTASYPDDAGAWNNLGVLRARQGRLTDAAFLLTRSQRNAASGAGKVDLPLIQHNLGCVMQHLRRTWVHDGSAKGAICPFRKAAVGSVAAQQVGKSLLTVYLYHNSLPWLLLDPASDGKSAWLSELPCIGSADAVVFDCHGLEDVQNASMWRDLHPAASAARADGQVWAMFCPESTARVPALLDPDFRGLFNVLVTHEKSADLPFTYMPRNLTLFANPPATKSAFGVWVASNCLRQRESLVEELMRWLPDGAIHSYGRCLHNHEWPTTQEPKFGSSKIPLLSRYKFTIAFENSQAEGYVTEKFFQPLIAGSVPVYWGAPDVGQYAPDRRSYIDASAFGSMRELASHLQYLDGNATAYEELQAWKSVGVARWQESFKVLAASSDITGANYGEAAHHGHPWLYNSLRLNALLREARRAARRCARDPSTDQCKAGRKLVANREPQAVDVQYSGKEFWWSMPVAFGTSTHHVRLWEGSSPEQVVAVYCSKHPCRTTDPPFSNLLRQEVERNLELKRARLASERTLDADLCIAGQRGAGFFSNFLQAVDALVSCSERGIPGAVFWNSSDVNFAYGGQDAGDNAWEGYFEPVGPNSSYTASKVLHLSEYTLQPQVAPTQFERYTNFRSDNVHSEMVTEYDRVRVHRAMRRLGIKPRADITQAVDSIASKFQEAIAAGATVVGIHYRATDHSEEGVANGRLVPLELFLHRAAALLRGSATSKAVLFVASDSEQAVEQVRAFFKGNATVEMVTQQSVVRGRTSDSGAVHHTNRGYHLGREVLMDSLLLSRCQFLVHSQSNVAVAAGYFNPDLKLRYISMQDALEFIDSTAKAAFTFEICGGSNGHASAEIIRHEASRAGLGGWVSHSTGGVIGEAAGPQWAVQHLRHALAAMSPLTEPSAASWVELSPTAPVTAVPAEFEMVAASLTDMQLLAPVQHSLDPLISEISGVLDRASCTALVNKARAMLAEGKGTGNQGSVVLPQSEPAAAALVARLQKMAPDFKLGPVLVRHMPLGTTGPPMPDADESVLGNFAIALSASSDGIPFVFPQLEPTVPGSPAKPNPTRSTCTSSCGAVASQVVQAAGAPYCCCVEVLRLQLAQGAAMRVGLAGGTKASRSLAFHRACPQLAPLLTLPASTTWLPGSWVAEVSLTRAL